MSVGKSGLGLVGRDGSAQGRGFMMVLGSHTDEDRWTLPQVRGEGGSPCMATPAVEVMHMAGVECTWLTLGDGTGTTPSEVVDSNGEACRGDSTGCERPSEGFRGIRALTENQFGVGE